MTEQQQQQQDLCQFLALLPPEQRQVFQDFIQCLSGTSGGTVQSYQSRLQASLHDAPYPTLQILQILHDRSKLHIGQIISAVLSEILANDITSRSLCVLANFPSCILAAATLRQKLMTRLVCDSATSEHLLLALLARQDGGQLLEDLLREQKQAIHQQCSEGAPTRQLVLWLALGQRENFVPTLCRRLKDFQCFADKTLRNTLLILKLANEFALGPQTLDELGYLDQALAAFDVAAVSPELQPVHQFFYADFQRLAVLLQFLRSREVSKTLKVEALLRAPGALSLVYDQNIRCDSQELFKLVEDTYKWQQQTPALKCLYHQEMETISYYTALGHVYNVILDQDEESSIKSKLLQLSSQLRQIHQLGTLCSLLEDIFLLVFLRWEQLDQTAQTTRRSENNNDNEEDDDDDEQYVDDEAPAPHTAPRQATPRVHYGFICRAPSLQALFTFLKSFVTKKLHSQDFKCASDHQARFQRLVDAISEALWKFGVLQKIEQSLAKSAPSLGCLLEPEQLLQLVQLHSSAREKASSDDESRERSNHASSLTRRKARKQRRAISFSGTVDMEQYRARAQLLSGGGNTKRGVVSNERSIIPKMLSTPEQLAIMALALKNFKDVKQIIETFGLEHSQLNRELQFMEQQQLIKQKLATIYANYRALEAKQGSPAGTTVEQIKGVAAKGFELSKIISVVDNFAQAQAQRLQQSPELKSLIQRHSGHGQYGFLQQFEERNLNALIICDLIVNLGFNREITCNLLLVIRRQQQQKQPATDEGAATSASSEIGAMNLLQNLCECMRLLERAGRQPALNELLSLQSQPLRPSVLAVQLQREAAFTVLYGKEPSDYAHSSELRAQGVHFQQLRSRHNYYGRFCGYIQQLARLLQLRDPNLEYHNSQLLRNDPYDVIGELIYECNITPLEIEANVAALHLNLVHVIALNICPQLGQGLRSRKQPRVVSPQKQESIHNYMAQHNQLLAQLLLAVQLGQQLPACSEGGLDFACLLQLQQLPEVEVLAAMHEGNRLLAALNAYKLDSRTLEQLVTSRELLLQILLLGIGGQSESLERLRCRIDHLIRDLIEEDARNIQLVVHMDDLGQRARLLKQHFTKIPSSQQAKELIERTLQHRQAAAAIPPALRSQLEHTLSDITIYARVSALLQFESWPQAYDFGRQTPNVIFEQLLQRRRYGLCLEWCRVVFQTGSEGQQRVCLLTLLDALLELRDGEELDGSLLGIVEMFPPLTLVNFLDTHKDKFRSLSLLQWVIDYLELHARDPRPYRNYQLSLVLLGQMDGAERQQFWRLLRHPLLIVEQLVMNARFEWLAKLLDAARARLQREKPLGPCPYCFEKRGHAYDVHSTATQPGKLRFQLGQATSEAFILLNFNSYQQDHFVGQECLDLLLRIYASKALDYRSVPSAAAASATEPSSLGTDLQRSLDSLCGVFVMPKEAPSREQWTPDEAAKHCMCCRRAAFTMLMRRHHCRRCGRVVCYACSTHRMLIPELYDRLEVRICNDCASALSATATGAADSSTSREHSTVSGSPSLVDSCKWRLSGNITHDKLLREEFSYEHAPSVAMSLSILRHHQDQRTCVELLLYHCRKLEKLIVPNPEVDYGLVAKMINCLAFAAKVRGATGEFENIREHSEIVMAVVQQGCESLVPVGPLDSHNSRQLADALVEAEHWTLALEVHLKFGFATTGVMAAHGLACLRAGCYDAAREKFGHCMTRLSNEQLNSCIYKNIFGVGTAAQTEAVLLPRKRPQRGPALLQEILQLIEAMPQIQPQPETLHRASLIRNSNTSLASLFTRRREPYIQQRPLQEPALNVMNALANLKNIAKGQYGGQGHATVSEESRRQGRGFEESLHYVLTYGSQGDILSFLMQREELRAALRYWQQQQLDTDLFIQHIFQPQLTTGQLPVLVEELQQLDDAQLGAWRLPLLQTCRHLEQQQQLNSLYQLQLLLKDPIRASMTCVKFYALHCENFQKLQANAQHLLAAHMHLQGELDLAEWEHLQRQQQGRRVSVVSAQGSSGSSHGACFAMQMDARALNGHINTIRRQMEVAKFLSQCEREQPADVQPLRTLKILKQIRLESSRGTLPTLFEGVADRIQLCILVLLCGKNIDEGFGLVYGIIQDYKLSAVKVFGGTAKYLARNQRLSEVDRLLDCIGSNNGGAVTSESDEILSIAINAAVHSNLPETKQTLDRLIKRISNVELRISSYMYIGQLKSAYLLANKYERLTDIRKILRQAELTNQIHIKKLCEMKLQLNQATNATTAATAASASMPL
ncbi:LOW QUALITY PROTEIN: zinc finger FYVE domain-containing protein 26 homolog [Drosophila obscura]|uniref:LOW QUALITY PROTEIN: zinc finger FYVE domain-containing protein 26 homolog n=1 Tax=Drosophila obscura TaxID=7282 RepID=UPI001BB24062|nr:LOW QUALITY PROTEIN: zinc finger FYVE domain-containing protein 26 homolog [Drosophila obscura]